MRYILKNKVTGTDVYSVVGAPAKDPATGEATLPPGLDSKTFVLLREVSNDVKPTIDETTHKLVRGPWVDDDVAGTRTRSWVSTPLNAQQLYDKALETWDSETATILAANPTLAAQFVTLLPALMTYREQRAVALYIAYIDYVISPSLTAGTHDDAIAVTAELRASAAKAYAATPS